MHLISSGRAALLGAALAAVVSLVSAGAAVSAPPPAGAPVSPAAPPVASRIAGKHLLLLYSNVFGLPAHRKFNDAFLAVAAAAGVPLQNVHHEYLDLIRNPSPGYRQRLPEWLREKYVGADIGAIVTVDGAAQEFMVREGRELFPAATIIAMLAPRPLTEPVPGRTIVQVPAAADFPGTLSLALKLFPKTSKVLLVLGDSEDEHQWRQSAQEAFAPWGGGPAIEYTAAYSRAQMLEKVAALPAESIVLYVSFYRDAAGQPFVPAVIASQVIATASVPVFGVYDGLIGAGIVGGSLFSYEREGDRAGRLAVGFLSGSAPVPVVPLTILPCLHRPMFDWKQLVRWGLTKTQLPAGGIIVGRPVSFWERNRGKVLATGGVVLLQLLLIVGLLVQRRLRRLAERTVRASEERFRLLIEQAPDAICVFDADLERFVDANTRAEKLFAVSREELLLSGPQRYFVAPQPDGLPPERSIAENIERVLAGHEVTTERVFRNSRGEDRYCEVRLALLPDVRRRLIRASYLDITERKRAEEQLLVKDFALNSSLSPIGLADLDGLLIYANDAFVRLWGYDDVAEVLGKHISSFAFSKEQAAAVAATLHEGKGYLGEGLSVRKDGTTFAARIAANLVQTPDGKPICMMASFIDITDLVRKESDVKALNDQLEQRVRERTADLEVVNRELEAFSYSISHDLRAPLRAIDGFSQILLEDFGPALPEVAQSHLKRVRAGTQRMGHLVDDLLEFSRLGKKALEVKTVAPAAIAREVVNDLRAAEPGRQVQVSVGELPSCAADPFLLRQVYVNLIGNAWKFTRGRAAAHVEIGSRAEAQGTVYFVRDNGVGFDMGHATKLFGVFQRLHRDDAFEGTGVGLAIVKRIVEKHGGRVWVEAAPDAGATFFFTLRA
jgi:PAS domain S-box-containing protein